MSRADCGESFGPVPNVLWSVKDSVSACPAGDSLVGTGHPSRLRGSVYYSDIDCNPRVGVPPESIWVTTSIAEGNLAVMGEGVKIFADDSTNTLGIARFTIPSFSGCGKVRLYLYVSGVLQGNKTARVRSTDSNADGRTTTSDGAFNNCDLNYDGTVDVGDQQVSVFHLAHWHRHALFGTPVQITNLCESCQPNDNGTIGIGAISWSPSGRYMAYSQHVGGCKVFFVPTTPLPGVVARQLTFKKAGQPDSADYDPAWSPLGTEIFFDRKDQVLYRKGVPGFNSDTTEVGILSSTQPVTYLSVSPDGNKLAFTRFDGTGGHICTIARTGGAVTQLTSVAGVNDNYPRWSPNGRTIVFDRSVTPGTRRILYTVRADTLPAPLATLLYQPRVLPLPAPTTKAILPDYSADGQVVVAGLTDAVATPFPTVLDSVSAVDSTSVPNYSSYRFSLPTPRISADGTRLGMIALPPSRPSAISPQVYAVRRNMNLPPQISSVGGQSIADSTARVLVNAIQGQQTSFSISASDPESNPLTYAAHFLQLGMAFDPITRNFTWTPPTGTIGNTYNVKFMVTTPTGGTDVIIAQITVYSGLAPAGASARTRPVSMAGASPAHGALRFSIPGPPRSTAQVSIHDVAGRLLDRFPVECGAWTNWSGSRRDLKRASPGIYLISAVAGGQRLVRRFVLLP